MAVAPIIGLLFSFYAVSNYQLWNTSLLPYTESTDEVDTGHGFKIFFEYKSYVGIACMYLYFAGFNIGVLPLKTLYSSVQRHYKEGASIGGIFD